MKVLPLLLCALLAPAVNAAAPAKAPTDTGKVAAEKKVAAMKEPEFCLALGKSIRETKTKPPTDYSRALIDRAVKQNHLKTFELEAIRTRSPAIGLSFCGMFAALGRHTRSHQYARPNGTSYQIVYEREAKTIRLHLNFIENEFRVTSWSD